MCLLLLAKHLHLLVPRVGDGLPREVGGEALRDVALDRPLYDFGGEVSEADARDPRSRITASTVANRRRTGFATMKSSPMHTRAKMDSNTSFR